MAGIGGPLAFLDASALYPALLRNILMRCAMMDLFSARWSEQIQVEWTRSVLRDRPNLSRAAIERTRRQMDENINDATVIGYGHLIESVVLPDPDDRHVLAAAIHCGASVIVTANLRDFPASVLSAHRIEPQHPDAFLLNLVAREPDQVRAALRQLRLAFNNPPMTGDDILAAMEKQGLRASAEALAALADPL